MKGKKVFPAGLLLENRHQLVICPNEEGFRKAGIALASGCHVTVIGVDPVPGVLALAKRKKIRFFERAWRSSDISPKYSVIISCLPGAGDNQKITALCGRRRIWVNILDRPDLCTFFAPAIHRSGPLTFSVFANGVAPIMLKRIREDLQKRYNNLGTLTSVVGEMRRIIKRRIFVESDRRRIAEELVTPEWISKIAAVQNRSRLKVLAQKRLNALIARHLAS